MLPLPVLPLNVTFTLTGAGAGGGVFSFHIALTSTLSLATMLSPGILSTAGDPVTVTDHLSNSLSAGAVKLHTGKVYSLSFTTALAGMFPLPLFLSKVTFTLGFALHIAVTLMLSLAVTFSPGFLSSAESSPILTDHLSNSIPSGAVKVHAGNLYSLYLFTSTEFILPLPPFLSKETVTFPGAGSTFHRGFTITS